MKILQRDTLVEPVLCLDLVQLAQDMREHLTYLHGVPEHLLATLDAARLVGGKTLPVHSFVLAATSAVLGEVLASQRGDSAASAGTKLVRLPLIDDLLSDVLAALKFLYHSCIPSKTSAAISERREGEAGVGFGKKYNVPVLLEAADGFLSEFLSVEYKAVQDTPFSQQEGRAKVTHDDTTHALAWVLYAEHHDLPKH